MPKNNLQVKDIYLDNYKHNDEKKLKIISQTHGKICCTYKLENHHFKTDHNSLKAISIHSDT